MPRLSNEKNVTAEAVPRKRVVRRTVAKKADDLTPRVTTSPRRAPTSIPSTTTSKRSVKRYAVLASVMLVVVVLAALIGNSDTGVVDVQARIAEKEQNEGRANIDVNNETSGSEVVPVQNTPPVLPVSSLRGSGVGSAPVTQSTPVIEEAPVEGEENNEAVSEVAQSEATSTDTIETAPPSEAVEVESETEVTTE